MKQTELIMGMPITVEILDATTEQPIRQTFDYFKDIDKRYSTYKKDSEIARINAGLPEDEWSEEMREVLKLCEQTKQLTNGFFNIEHDGQVAPSGLVKGWAINNAAQHLVDQGFSDFYIEAGGDIQAYGSNNSKPWLVGIRNPFNLQEIVKSLAITNRGVATSGTYVRGQHIYNPHSTKDKITGIKSLTVIGPNIYEADRFATAAFAMGLDGINFIEKLDGFEAYMIDSRQTATLTSGLKGYLANA